MSTVINLSTPERLSTIMQDKIDWDIPCYEPIDRKEFDWEKFIIFGVCYCPLCKAMGWNGYSKDNNQQGE